MPNLRFYIYAGLLLCIVLYGLMHWNYLQASYQLLLALVGMCLCGESYTQVLKYQQHNAAPFYHFYAVVEYAFLAVIYYQVALRRYRWSRVWVGVSIVVFTLFSFTNSFYIQDLTTFPSYAVMLASLLYTFMSMIAIVAMVRFPDDEPIYYQPAFWFNLGTLLFYLFSFFAFGFYAMKNVPEKVITILLDIVYGANILLYIFYAIALFMNIRSSKGGSSIRMA